MLAENIIMHFDLVDSRVVNRESAVCHSFLFTFDDFLAPFHDILFSGEIRHHMLMRIETVQQFLLFLYLSANNSQVEHLNEMRDIHTCVLYDVPELLIGIDRRLVVIFRLHYYVLKLHEETLCFAEHFVRNDLLGVVRRLRTLDSVLQGVKTS